jgi:hypothetical protein
MIPSLLSFIDKTGTPEILVRENEKIVTFMSSDNACCFGFRKTKIEQPIMPINIEMPTIGGFKVDKALLIKKLKRLSLASKDNLGVRISLKEDGLELSTETDRKSLEKMPFKGVSGTNPIDFVINCTRFRDILNLFQAPDVDIYVDKKTCTIYSPANIVIEEDGKELIQKPFTAIGLMTLARVI